MMMIIMVVMMMVVMMTVEVMRSKRANGRNIARTREAGTAGAIGLSFTMAEKILSKC
jgi:hypothetical protein